MTFGMYKSVEKHTSYQDINTETKMKKLTSRDMCQIESSRTKMYNNVPKSTKMY